MAWPGSLHPESFCPSVRYGETPGKTRSPEQRSGQPRTSSTGGDAQGAQGHWGRSEEENPAAPGSGHPRGGSCPGAPARGPRTFLARWLPGPHTLGTAQAQPRLRARAAGPQNAGVPGPHRWRPTLEEARRGGSEAAQAPTPTTQGCNWGHVTPGEVAASTSPSGHRPGTRRPPGRAEPGDRGQGQPRASSPGTLAACRPLHRPQCQPGHCWTRPRNRGGAGHHPRPLPFALADHTAGAKAHLGAGGPVAEAVHTAVLREAALQARQHCS